MANKRIRLKEGLVQLSGFTPEVSREMEEYILKFEPKGLNIIKTVPVPVVVVAEIPSYSDKALGLKKTGGQYEVVVVGYDKDTKQASVEEVKPAGDFHQHAMSVFQMELMKKGLI